MSQYTMTIDGKAVAGAGEFGVINPSTGRVFANAPECSRDQLDQAMEAAARAFKGWSRDEPKRRQVLLDCAKALQAKIGELAPLLTQEQGKPLKNANEELFGAAIWFQYTASLQIPVEVIQDNDAARIEVRRRPYGVVGAITPWNFPMMLAVWKIAPALLAGNTIVLKPSPYTPLSTLALGEMLRDVLPPGVVNVVSGGNDLGAWISSHPTPRKVSFTGSVATGKKVAIAAAPDLKRLTLELGGNDPAIVLRDADPAKIAEKLFWGAFTNCGQVCSAVKRIYVHESLYDDLSARLAGIAKGLKVGDGLDPTSQLGPINNQMQFERVSELVDDAREHGAKVLSGGRRIGSAGLFYEPTILADVSDGTRIVDEEQFGPALPLVRYRDVEDAIERANATHFGLGGSVWGGDVQRAAEIAGRLECGTSWVNTHLAVLPNLPFGGAKWSGIGVENGPWGLLGFTELQTVHIARG